MSDWQPIDSAPRNGTVVDLWGNGGRYHNAFWRKYNEDYHHMFDEDCDRIDCWWAEGQWFDGMDGPIDPDIVITHWMPRPGAPA